ncbi:MAG: hypothetical protein WCT45_00965 [Candidatus Paceibacterota bacterium]|jgi:hypothetical protein
MEHLISEAIIYGPGYFMGLLKMWPWLWPWALLAAIVMPLMFWLVSLARMSVRSKSKPRKK